MTRAKIDLYGRISDGAETSTFPARLVHQTTPAMHAHDAVSDTKAA